MGRRKIFPERLNVALAEGMRARLDAVAERRQLDRLAVIREALDRYCEAEEKAETVKGRGKRSAGS